MRILQVTAAIEFPLASYCLAAQADAVLGSAGLSQEILHLDLPRLNVYERKSTEHWRYLAAVEAFQPDVVCFSVYLWNHLAIRELIAITRRLFRNLRIVVGGPELQTCSAADGWVAEEQVVAVRGEGERTYVEAIERFMLGADLHGVDGLSWWDGSAVVHERPRAPARDLAAFASPFLNGWVPRELFQTASGRSTAGRYSRALLETYRGCYMGCSYCQWGNGTKYRFSFPEERVRREITLLVSWDVRAIFFVDAMFGYKKQVAKSLLQHVIEEKRRFGSRTGLVLYHNQDFYDPELFDLYRQAGACIEVEIQSTNLDVLSRVGRAKWYLDSFDRHRAAIERHRVPSTGAADLIVGLPGDSLASFEDSIDALLQRGMRVRLFQGSILPDTGWSRTLEQDGTIHSPIPPRAIFGNATFPLADVLAARTLLYGLDLFNWYPRTAALLWRRYYDRPVDLCRAVGQAIYRQHGLVCGETHEYSAVLLEDQRILAEVVQGLCPEPAVAAVAADLCALEAALARRTLQEFNAPGLTGPDQVPTWAPSGEGWLDERPRFRAEACERVPLRHRVDALLDDQDIPSGRLSAASVQVEPIVALVYANNGARYLVVDPALTDNLLRRFNGYFTVAACLDNLGADWRQMRHLSSLWEMLGFLARAGLIEPGPDSAARPSTPGRQLVRR